MNSPLKLSNVSLGTVPEYSSSAQKFSIGLRSRFCHTAGVVLLLLFCLDFGFVTKSRSLVTKQVSGGYKKVVQDVDVTSAIKVVRNCAKKSCSPGTPKLWHYPRQTSQLGIPVGTSGIISEGHHWPWYSLQTFSFKVRCLSVCRGYSCATRPCKPKLLRLLMTAEREQSTSCRDLNRFRCRLIRFNVPSFVLVDVDGHLIRRRSLYSPVGWWRVMASWIVQRDRPRCLAIFLWLHPWWFSKKQVAFPPVVK